MKALEVGDVDEALYQGMLASAHQMKQALGRYLELAAKQLQGAAVSKEKRRQQDEPKIQKAIDAVTATLQRPKARQRRQTYFRFRKIAARKAGISEPCLRKHLSTSLK